MPAPRPTWHEAALALTVNTGTCSAESTTQWTGPRTPSRRSDRSCLGRADSLPVAATVIARSGRTVARRTTPTVPARSVDSDAEPADTKLTPDGRSSDRGGSRPLGPHGQPQRRRLSHCGAPCPTPPSPADNLPTRRSPCPTPCRCSAAVVPPGRSPRLRVPARRCRRRSTRRPRQPRGHRTDGSLSRHKREDAGGSPTAVATPNPTLRVGAVTASYSHSRRRNDRYSPVEMTTMRALDTSTPQCRANPGYGTFIP